MYELSVTAEFSSAHNLRGYMGKCESLHGHNWQVEVVVASEVLDKIGIAIDFKMLKKVVHTIVVQLDHKHLNTLPYFKKVNPTSEQIAHFIFDKVKQRLKRKRVRVQQVSVWESKSSKATYYET